MGLDSSTPLLQIIELNMNFTTKQTHPLRTRWLQISSCSPKQRRSLHGQRPDVYETFVIVTRFWEDNYRHIPNNDHNYDTLPKCLPLQNQFPVTSKESQTNAVNKLQNLNKNLQSFTLNSQKSCKQNVASSQGIKKHICHLKNAS